jgi:DNA-binding NtrC family response regulator/GGDEF domain-containing protein
VIATVLASALLQVAPATPGAQASPAFNGPPRPEARAAWVDPRTLVLDGDPSEWTAGRDSDCVLHRPDQLVNLGGPPTELWAGEDDASVRLWVGWNETDLVLGGLVRDESADYDATNWWRGDSLELYLGFSVPAPEWKSDDFQLMLAPDWPERPWGIYPHRPGEAPSDGGFGGVEVSSWPLPGGYRFEARLPWRNFVSEAPAAGRVLSFNLALTDRDGRGKQESYLTWTGEREIAVWADRRGSLRLEPAPVAAAGDAPPSTDERRLPLPSVTLVMLVVMYGLALATRRVWRTGAARRRGVLAAAGLLAVSLSAVLAARYKDRQDAAERESELAQYWSQFETLLRSGALGHPEPELLHRDAQALLSGKSISPQPELVATHLSPPGATLLPARVTAQRALPFRPIVPEGRLESDPAEGLVLEPGESTEFPLAGSGGVDALALVMRVSDRRYLRSGTAQIPVLAIDLLQGDTVIGAPYEVRHRQDLHLDEDEHRDRPGLEPAFRVRGGPLGELHGDGLFLDLGVRREIDRVRIRHVGPLPGYSVDLVALTLLTREPRASLPPGIRTTASGEWEWADWRNGVEVELAHAGRAAKEPAGEVLVRELRLGAEAVASIRLSDTTPAKNPTRWDFLPIVVAAALAPFLVALLAEWLSGGQRIRAKLAVGFAITSAVPLLVLTLLLEASLGKEHEVNERERVESVLARAQIDLEREQRELEQEARRLLSIAQLVSRAEGRLPASSEELSSSAWWGEGEPSVVRLFETIEPGGEKLRIGAGPGWRQIPRNFAPPASGLARPWGQLVVCGVAQTASGSDRPMLVIVARPARLEALARAQLRLVGAERDPAPTPADLDARLPGEVRRGLYSRDGSLAAVLVAAGRERGVPLLGDYSLNELLLAAGLTALFTAMLFAGILTGHIVAPIERLDRAVREGRADSLPSSVEVEDEVGHLTGAVQSFVAQLEHRVRQLELLRTAQEDLSSHLDADLAREAVLEFFQSHTQAAALWLAWSGETGEEERLYARDGRNLAVPEGASFFQRALASTEVFDLRPGLDSTALTAADRELLGDSVRALSLPLLAGGDCRGGIVIALADAERHVDLAFLRTAASQSAIVLENARLYHQAVTDSVTGFLSEPGFKQRFSEEIQRCEGRPDAGVLLVQVRIGGLPKDDARAHARLREAARRMRLSVRALAVFGRSGSADLHVALPWSDARPDFDALEARIADRVRLGAWPDGELVEGVTSAHAAWPDDGASSRLVLHAAGERIVQGRRAEAALPFADVEDRLPLDFVARSPLMAELLETVRRVAEREATLLIAGETGVGKDRIAKLVHEWSPRHGGPLVHIHCPSLSTSLIEDELFGHEVGAFTGASTRRVGPFEFARGGTIVLDEIAGLPHGGQVALLRLLETREVLPLGATATVPIDVRVLATTSADLGVEVERGRFRSDLYFRLNVAQVLVPPLRLRRQDIPGLVEASLRRHNASAARPVTGVSPAVLDLFFDYSWPGNLRELENVLSRAFLLGAGSELTLEHVELAPEAGVAEGAGDRPLNDRQTALLDGLQPGARVSSAAYAAQHGISSRTGLRDLLDLVAMGYLAREGTKRGTRFRRTQRAWAAVHGQ